MIMLTQSTNRKFLRVLRIKIWLYAKSWKRCVQRTHKTVLGLRLHMRQTITEGTRIVCRLMNLVVKVLLKCVIRFSISFRWCAFQNFCTQISCPLAHCTVYASSRKVARPLMIHDVTNRCYSNFLSQRDATHHFRRERTRVVKRHFHFIGVGIKYHHLVQRHGAHSLETTHGERFMDKQRPHRGRGLGASEPQL